MEELSRHNTSDDCWIALEGFIYDISAYLEYHPGGIDILLEAAGTDVTSLFSID